MLRWPLTMRFSVSLFPFLTVPPRVTGPRASLHLERVSEADRNEGKVEEAGHTEGRTTCPPNVAIGPHRPLLSRPAQFLLHPK